MMDDQETIAVSKPLLMQAMLELERTEAFRYFFLNRLEREMQHEQSAGPCFSLLRQVEQDAFQARENLFKLIIRQPEWRQLLAITLTHSWEVNYYQEMLQTD